MCLSFFFFSSRRRHTRCALVTGVQTCALPIFSLSANARVVVNEFVYNPAGTTNAMGVSLIQGTFVFVTGEIAPSGEMDVATPVGTIGRSEEHTSELQSLMRISYAVFCLKNKKTK